MLFYYHLHWQQWSYNLLVSYSHFNYSYSFMYFSFLQTLGRELNLAWTPFSIVPFLNILFESSRNIQIIIKWVDADLCYGCKQSYLTRGLYCTHIVIVNDNSKWRSWWHNLTIWSVTLELSFMILDNIYSTSIPYNHQLQS